MHPALFALAAAVAPPAAAEDAIVVTASREPVAEEEAGASATLMTEETLRALDLPSTSDILRLVPGVSVSASGSRGSLTEVRIRGAEAKHSLIFIDGIKFNDPALGNTARFELLTNDALSRVEIVRGPQSALWGSEALGGVIAVETADAFERTGLSALSEYGSLDSFRGSAQGAVRSGVIGLAGSAGWLRTDGIDIQGPSGERDGFDNRSASLKATFRLGSAVEGGLAGHWIEGKSEYDGFDPATFAPSEDVETRSRVGAARAWTRATPGQWVLSADTSFLDSDNRNFFAGDPVNRTYGERLTGGFQVSRRIGDHRLTAAAEHEREEFHARDQSYFGATEQDRVRTLTALVGEWRAGWGGRLTTGLALRHDRFSAFADATTFRADASLRASEDVTFHVSYGEGIAQPTFYDLYGFYPELGFTGNPKLRPESSRGWEAALRWSDGNSAIGVTGFRHNLVDENLLVFDAGGSTTVNSDGESKRKGLEVDASHAFSNQFRLSANYTLLDAEEQRTAAGLPVREQRRPRHSANLIAAGRLGPIEFGSSLAYVGRRKDTDFSSFPSKPVELDDYVLASVKAGWQLTRQLEAYVRAENAFGAQYQDVVGYNTAGRTVYAGLRVRLGD
ncbi:MAG TPA: TonB-dependent receptor [Allosphingosinicella sp.]